MSRMTDLKNAVNSLNGMEHVLTTVISKLDELPSTGKSDIMAATISLIDGLHDAKKYTYMLREDFAKLLADELEDV